MDVNTEVTFISNTEKTVVNCNEIAGKQESLNKYYYSLQRFLLNIYRVFQKLVFPLCDEI